ncbi:MAG: rod shape-determining protein MreD [Pseudomonadota bacterium]
MPASFTHRDDPSRPLLQYWPVVFVYVLLTICFLADMIYVPGWSNMLLRPSFTFICIFYWALYRPRLIPFGLVFVMGIIFDAVAGTLLGLHALIWMGCLLVLRSQRRFLMGQSFMVVWVTYALCALIAGLMGGRVSFAELFMMRGDTLQAWGGFMVGLFFFPPVALILHFIHRHLPFGKANSHG